MSLQIVQNQQLKPIGDKVPIDTQLSTTSENAISNKAVTEEINQINSDLTYNSTTSWTTAYSNAKNEIIVFWKSNVDATTLSITIPKIEIGTSARSYNTGYYYSSDSCALATISLSATSVSNAMLTMRGSIVSSSVVYYYK